MIANLIDPFGTLGEIRPKLSLLLALSLASTLVSLPLGFILGIRLFGGFLIVLLIPAVICFAKAIKALGSIGVDASENLVRFYKGHFIFLGITLVASIVDYVVSPHVEAYSYFYPKLATSVVYRDLFACVIAIQLFATISLFKAIRDASRMKAGHTAAGAAA